MTQSRCGGATWRPAATAGERRHRWMAVVQNSAGRNVTATRRRRWRWASSWRRPCGRCTSLSGPASAAPVSYSTRGLTAGRSLLESGSLLRTAINRFLVCASRHNTVSGSVSLVRMDAVAFSVFCVQFMHIYWLERTPLQHFHLVMLTTQLNVIIFIKLNIRRIAVFCKKL